MPTYDYVCDACNHKFEHFQGINDPLLMKCSECGKKKLRRLFGTGAALMFKGSGFYTTDYRSESYQKGADAEKSSQKSANGEGKSGEGKSAEKSSDKSAGESKSESKSDSASSPKSESSAPAKTVGKSSTKSSGRKRKS